MSGRQTGPSWIDAAEAARLLRVSRATLYAYVSRGFVRSQSTAGPSRRRRYSREDVERLQRRTEERRDPAKAAARALQWGVPVLESSIALIDGAALYYRGHDAVQLARTRSVAEVASLIWTSSFETRFKALLWRSATTLPGLRNDAPASRSDRSLPFAARAQSMLARAAAHDPQAFDLRPASVALTGWRILALLTQAATAGRPSADTVEATLARAWRVGASGADLLRAALILCADHELNVSSFTARCVASAGSNPYAVVTAGLAALEGTRHGGTGARVEAVMDSMRRARSLRIAIGERMKRGEPIDGFGHPLYHGGDPRATALLELLRERYAASAELRFTLDFADAAGAALRERPNIDFALAALTRVLRLPPGSPLTLFGIGRSIGWIGHAIEQYATGQLIRPRAKYVGVPPAVA